MKTLITILSLSLFACSAVEIPSRQAEAPQPMKVWANEYIVDAGGQWCPWAPGISACVKALDSGTYIVDDIGTAKLVAPYSLTTMHTRQVQQYDPSKDLCKTKLKDYMCSPNWVVYTSKTPNDPLYDRLWGLKEGAGIGAERAWKTLTESTVPVAVLDTGINCDHPDINCIGGYNAITGKEGIADQRDDNGHGTHVAGTICGRGNNNTGVTGVAWSCPLVGIKFLRSDGSGSLFDAIRGLDFATSQGIRVINNSWGGGGYSPQLRGAIERANSTNALFIAAAGNSGVNTDVQPHYPSAYDVSNVISVGSIGSNGEISQFSNYGHDTVDIYAPGDDIISANYTGGYISLSGTSMATPHLSGFAALALQHYPGLSNGEFLELLKGSLIKDSRYADRSVYGGRLHIGSAFRSKPCGPKLFNECCKECCGLLCTKNKRITCRKEYRR